MKREKTEAIAMTERNTPRNSSLTLQSLLPLIWLTSDFDRNIENQTVFGFSKKTCALAQIPRR
jgi:hypothetical protein